MFQALLLGLLASLFFSLTFVLNHVMQISGGHWIWTASLRFVFMLPMLFVLTIKEQRYKKVFQAIRIKPLEWFIWSTVGFGLFYLPLCIAASYGPSWMIASTWQITIVAGIMLSPLFHHGDGDQKIRHTIPIKQLIISGLIIAGVFLVQFTDGSVNDIMGNIPVILLILIAAFSYPLGNRKMLTTVPESFGTLERVFGMTICSMPFWIVMMLIGLIKQKYPTVNQVNQTIIVALSSGVVATLLFFAATKRVKNNIKQIAVIESTQAGEVFFTLVLGLIFFEEKLPSLRGFIGILVIIAGIILNSFSVTKQRRTTGST